MIKRIEENFDADTGVSCVKIRTNLGDFCGYAFLNTQEDKLENASKLLGLELAEARAYINFFKTKQRNINIQLNAYYLLKRDFKKIKNQNDTYCNLLDRRISMLESEKEDIKDVIKGIYASIDEKIISAAEYQRLKEKIINKRKMKEDSK